MDKYTVLGRIGEGAHGYVLYGKRNRDSKEVALKKVLVKKLSEGIPIPILREIKTMQALESEYVMELLDFFPKGAGFVLVTDFMPSGLWEVIHDEENPPSEALTKSYMAMLLKGVSHLHENGIMHRDLKPANLLIGSDGILRIGDFGQARPMWKEKGKPYTQQVATRWYRAPELLYGTKKYTEAIDLWAVGCIFAELINKKPLFPGETDIDQLAVVIKSLGTPNEVNWPGHSSLPDYNKISFVHSKPIHWTVLVPGANPTSLDLVKSFVMYNSRKRLQANQALNHPYFTTAPLALCETKLPKPPHNHRSDLKARDYGNKAEQDYQALHFLLDTVL
uniref:Cyclin-dependent kinase 20 n=1 Tax=Panstrongylus lignarius TaxID=156445 RepID=A0A224XFJ1_9HEMI